MDSSAIITLLREGLFLVLLLSAAPMLASLVIGLTISMFQAVTQLQEQTLSYVPKVVGVLDYHRDSRALDDRANGAFRPDLVR